MTPKRTSAAWLGLCLTAGGLIGSAGCGGGDGAGAGGAAGADAGPESLVGKPLPFFQLRDLGLKDVSDRDLRGKVALIDFWATWCAPCRALSPALQSLHDKLGKHGLMVVGVNMSERDADGQRDFSGDNARAYAAKNKLTYTILYAGEGFAQLCNVDRLPTILIVDRTGIIRHALVGLDPSRDQREMLEALIRPLLE